MQGHTPRWPLGMPESTAPGGPLFKEVAISIPAYYVRTLTSTSPRRYAPPPHPLKYYVIMKERRNLQGQPEKETWCRIGLGFLPSSLSTLCPVS